MRLAITALLLAVVITVAPIMALAAPTSADEGLCPTIVLTWLLAYEQEIEELVELRDVELTPGAMEIVLQDFDYLVSMILDVSPVQNIIGRRIGIDARFYFTLWREIIYSKMPLPSIISSLEPERWGEPQTDDLSIAADYLFTVMVGIMQELGGLGHFSPQVSFMVEQMFHASAHTLHNGIELNQEDIDWMLAHGFSEDDIEMLVESSLRFSALQYELFIPSVMWFYDIDPSEFDLETPLSEVMGTMDEYNITTQIIEPGRIAYIRIQSFMNNLLLDSETLFPFYEEIQDFEHLIIDLRGNGGGWASSFPTNVVSMLIDERIDYTTYEFFIASDRIYDYFNPPLALRGGTLYGVFTVSEFLRDRGMNQFNRHDAQLLDYVSVWNVSHFPAYGNIPFGGKVWLLIDSGSASASETAASIAINTGFATVVGQPTAGVTGVTYTFAAMPNTGILFRIDLGYTVDRYGRSIEEFGIIPQVLNRSGMDALETVLAIINNVPYEVSILPRPLAEGDMWGTVPVRTVYGETFVPIRLTAYAHSFNVEWDGYKNAVMVITPDGSYTWVYVGYYGVFNDNGTVFLPLSKAREIFQVTLPVSPLVGTWTWDVYSGYRYVFNSDGTGNRGIFGEYLMEFTWSAEGNQLNIDIVGYLPANTIRNERWYFVIVGNVLTIESAQIEDMVFNYNRA